VSKFLGQLNGSAINLSTGILTSFKTYAQLVCNKLGYDPVISGTSNKPEGVFARGGCTKKQQSFGLSYDINFDSGVDLAIKYFENKL
jgi:nucleoside-diphosphate-sugar epimerase